MAISETELTQARTHWGEGLVDISKAHEAGDGETVRSLAEDMLDKSYGYNWGPVLFKPTLASGEGAFRPTRKGALSYFIGSDTEFPLDTGFALKGWREVTSKTAASFIEGDVAMWAGWVELTDKDGKITTVDKSWGYKKDAQGSLRIILHHSSLPYEP